MVKLILAIMLMVVGLNAKDVSSQVVINEMIKAYGGEEKLSQLNVYEQFWFIDRKTSDTGGSDYRLVMMPDYLSTKLRYPEKTEVRVLDKHRGTKFINGSTIKAEGPMLDAMKLQMMRLLTPIELQKVLNDITLSSDNTHYILSLKAGTLTAEYYVSKATHFIDQVIGRLQMGSQSMEFLTKYEEYKDVHGVMMAHKEIKYAGGVHTAVMSLQETRFQEPK